MNQFFLYRGDITTFSHQDAITTLLNSEGAWHGGVDKAIQRVAGQIYHDQARAVLNSAGLSDKQVVVATGDSSAHTGSFDNVIFVVDDLESPLNVLVYSALKAAKDSGYDK